MGDFLVKPYVGDAKTLLAFNLPKGRTKNLAGFTIQCEPEGQAPFYLHNTLRFETPGDHAQDPKEPSNSSINAPFRKFRWLHVPGSVHQGIQPVFGKYTYTATPRYFDDQGSMQPLDRSLSAKCKVMVRPFEQKGLRLGFTRGFVQSQAFTQHFGLKARIRPPGDELLYDTSQLAGTNAAGEQFSYAQAYEWLGYTARQRIFELLAEALADASLQLDVFAYDLNEPDIIRSLLQLAKQGRIRIILDNASLHHDAAATKPEDEFEQEFLRVAKAPAAILRGKFKRYSHDKIFILSRKGKALRIMTGSTNFSVTGLYVNSNHVIVLDDRAVADQYARVFEAAWQGKAKQRAFLDSPLSAETFSFSSSKVPDLEVSFSPHDEAFATDRLESLVTRIQKESKSKGSVLFAVMQLDNASGPVLPALRALHAQQQGFSIGISDTTSGIELYAPGRKTGLLVTGKPTSVRLPPPFNQVPSVAGHQIHHKFVVCGFNGNAPVVYCGSSNLALGGEQENGDNLIDIHDTNVATAFAIEALALVDHFQFLNRFASNKSKPPPANKTAAAAAAGGFLIPTDAWARSYYDPDDLHARDRLLFGTP